MGSSFSLTLQGLKILCYTSLCNTRKVPQEQKCLLFHSPCIWCFIPSGTTCLPKDCLTTVWQFPNGKKCWVSSKGREELFEVLYLILVKSKQLYPFNISHACCIKYGVKVLSKEEQHFSILCSYSYLHWGIELHQITGWIRCMAGGRHHSGVTEWAECWG